MADFRTAAFRTERFTVSLGAGMSQREFPFRVLPAQEWLEIFGSNSWITAVINTIPAGSFEEFLDAVEREELWSADVTAFAHSALAQSAGRPWWEAERLVGACFHDGGRLLGTLLGNGTDPSRMTLAVFLACVWAALTKNADAEGLLKLEAALLVPPPDATDEERAGLDDEDMHGMVDRLRAMPGVRTG